jgi:stearoyl-CoA desaturase (delta-9 desaturase)
MSQSTAILDNKTKVGPSEIRGYNWPSLLWLLTMHIGAIAALFFFSKANLVAEIIMYFITGCLGITLGYHRIMAHRALGVPKWLERVFVTCGALAMEGGPIKWCAHHRMHHANPDTENDPHNSRHGFFYCHVGWTLKFRPFFDSPDKLRRFSRDINQDPYYRWLDTTMGQFLPQLALATILFAIGGIGMVLWGVCLRMVLV